jgi:hypothetical protein
MSLVLSSRRRIYVLLLFRERLDGMRAASARAPVERALDAGRPRGAPAVQNGHARLAVLARVQRRWDRSVVGLSLFVLTLEPDDRRR